jgi:type I restriction enzyme, R subunit
MMLFDLLQKEGLDKASRERVKQASRELLASIKVRLAELDRFWEKEQTKADVEVSSLMRCSPSSPPHLSPPKRRRPLPATSMPTSGSRP